MFQKKSILKSFLCILLTFVLSLSPTYAAKATEVTPNSGITVYFDNSFTQWTTPNVHYWGTETTTWPGKPLTATEGKENVYQITLPEGTNGLVFNDGGNGNQSTDVTGLENNATYGAVAVEGGKFVVLKANEDGTIPSEPSTTDVTPDQTQPKQVNVHVGTTPDTVYLSFTTKGNTKTNDKYDNTPIVIRNNDTEINATKEESIRFSFVAGLKYLHSVKITGLQPSTAYEYTIGSGEFAYTGSFKTIPASGTKNTFKFGYITDPQVSNATNAKACGATFNQLNSIEDLGFVYIAGDITDNATTETQWEQIFDNGGLYPSAGQQYLGNHLLAAAQGNHDISTLSGHITAPKESDAAGDAVYSLDYGPAKFIILNLETAKSNDTVRESQKQFLETKIAEAKTAGQWTIVGFHKSIYTGASHIVDKDIVAARKYWAPVLADLDVDMVLQGHDHVYCRGFIEADGSKADMKTDSDGAYIKKQNAPLYMVGGHAGGLKWYAQKEYTVEDGDPLLPNYTFLDKNSTDDKSNEKQEQVYTVFEVSEQAITSTTYMMKYDTETDTLTTAPYEYDSFTLKKEAVSSGEDTPTNSYSITYELNGGSFTGDVVKNYDGTTDVSLATPVKKGYIFAGWYTDNSYTEKVTSIQKGSTGNITFYAKWEEEQNSQTTNNSNTIPPATNSYSITYELNGGSFTGDTVKNYDGTADVSLTAPVKKGYTFAGWYTDSSYKEKVTSIQKGSTGNKTFYAKWQKVSKPSKPTVSSVKKNKKANQMTVKLKKKVSGATGYEVVYATNSKFTKGKKVVRFTGTSKTIKNLKKGTKYYVKVRAYTLDSTQSRIYGNYSKKITVK
ncbi:MAG: InlB B-repeat-containing protein [Clostridiales bacterium]|nr:InlB B-repeat-containing protein [Clostridiales bacterium]